MQGFLERWTRNGPTPHIHGDDVFSHHIDAMQHARSPCPRAKRRECSALQSVSEDYAVHDTNLA